jgi:hypothetical protein
VTRLTDLLFTIPLPLTCYYGRPTDNCYGSRNTQSRYHSDPDIVRPSHAARHDSTRRAETILGFLFFFTISSISDSHFLSDSRSLPFLIYGLLRFHSCSQSLPFLIHDLLRVPFLFHDLFLGLSQTVHVSLLFPDSVTTATAFR